MKRSIIFRQKKFYSVDPRPSKLKHFLFVSNTFSSHFFNLKLEQTSNGLIFAFKCHFVRIVIITSSYDLIKEKPIAASKASRCCCCDVGDKTIFENRKRRTLITKSCRRRPVGGEHLKRQQQRGVRKIVNLESFLSWQFGFDEIFTNLPSCEIIDHWAGGLVVNLMYHDQEAYGSNLTPTYLKKAWEKNVFKCSSCSKPSSEYLSGMSVSCNFGKTSCYNRYSTFVCTILHALSKY